MLMICLCYDYVMRMLCVCYVYVYTYAFILILLLEFFIKGNTLYEPLKSLSQSDLQLCSSSNNFQEFSLSFLYLLSWLFLMWDINKFILANTHLYVNIDHNH